MNEYKTLDELYAAKVQCTACSLRAACTQVVPGTGSRDKVALLIIAEAPGENEDEEGEVLIGSAGQALRTVLRSTGILNRQNTLMTNVLGCRPPKNKFPKDDCPEICVTKWLWEEIRLAQPKRILLLGSVPLQYVAGLDGITNCRGQWYSIRGIRTMATFHPSFILRKDNEGIMSYRDTWVKDIKEVAGEIQKEIQKDEGKSVETEQSNITEESTTELT